MLSSKSTIAPALRRTLRISEKSHMIDLQSPFVQESIMWFCNPYYAIGLRKEIPWEDKELLTMNIGVLKLENFTLQKEYIMKLPDLDSLKLYVKNQKKFTKNVKYSFGYMVVNAQYLLDIMTVLPNVNAYSFKRTYDKIYFYSEDGYAILCPIHYSSGLCPPKTELESNA